MKTQLSFSTAGLLALLHFHSLCYGGAASSLKRQPQASIVNKLRAALDSRTDELTQQKNIAHGLELEVRELQTELVNEKKALQTETQKEQTMQQKLKTIRSVLDDGDGATSSKSAEKGTPLPAASPVVLPAASPVVAPMSDDDALLKGGPNDGLSFEATLSKDLDDIPPAEDIAPLDDVAAPQPTLSKPLAATRQLTPQAPPLAPKPLPVVAPRQAIQKELRPPAQAASAQSARVTKAKPVALAKRAAAPTTAKGSQATPMKATQARATRSANDVINRARSAAAAAATKKVMPQPAKTKRALAPPLLRGAGPVSMPARPAKVAPAATMRAKPTAEMPVLNTLPNGVADTSSSAASDFDALEAQLHEEDKRIQDLDKENLDGMSDDSPPLAASPPEAVASKAAAKAMPAENAPLTASAPETVATKLAVKASAAQPKMEVLSEAPIEDVLAVEAAAGPTPDLNEVAASTALADPAVESDADKFFAPDSADAASDNKLIAQIAADPGRA